MIADILTAWAQVTRQEADGSTSIANYPAVIVDHVLGVGDRVEDITGSVTIPDPNLCGVRFTGSAGWLTEVSADNNYLVLWSDDA